MILIFLDLIDVLHIYVHIYIYIYMYIYIHISQSAMSRKMYCQILKLFQSVRIGHRWQGISAKGSMTLLVTVCAIDDSIVHLCISLKNKHVPICT